ncbi:MAG: hypothetical protein JWQ79_2679 [Mucilaginibacter sp.]|nr:hypothetical protein [Mucilaginibacter sp.]
MKRISQYLILTGLSGLLCLFLAVPANAQRGGGHSGGGGHGGGGGGFHGGGGGGGSHFSGGGGFRGNSGGSFHQPANSGGHFNSFQGRNNNVNGGARNFSNRGGVVNGNGRSFSRAGVAAGGYRGSVAARGGFVRNGRYYAGGYGRSFARGGGYGYRYSPWRAHGGFYFNRGFYGSLYYPRLGFSLGFLPFGYYPFYWGDAQFYYSDGYFYNYDNNEYTVVEPPIGAAINTLPSKAQPITINGQQYYELNGVYYLPVTKDDGTVVYQIAGKDGQLDTSATDNGGYTNNGNGGGNNNGPAVASPEIGDLFYSLPPDTRKIKLNGELYYVSPDDFYYQEARDQSGKKAYKVVGTPDDAPGN